MGKRSKGWVFLLLAITCAGVVASEKRPDRAGMDRCLARLSDERFSEREAAVEDLIQMGAGVFAQLKQVLEKTGDQELRIRLRAIVKRLALTAETDPEALAQYAREEAGCCHFSDSAHFYARAAAAFRERAVQGNSLERQVCEQRARLAELRAQRAADWVAALHSGRVLEQAGRSFIILSRESNGQTAVEYQEIDLQSLTRW